MGQDNLELFCPSKRNKKWLEWDRRSETICCKISGKTGKKGQLKYHMVEFTTSLRKYKGKRG
jgi:hypothetical protein